MLKSDGTVWASGYNWFGTTGQAHGTTSLTVRQILGLSGIVAIAAGKSHCLALKSDGTVWGWGLNKFGALTDAVPLSASGIKKR